MERKEYDLFLNVLSNPQSSIDGLITSGLSIDNTSLQDKSVYENNDEIREQFKDQYGEFDKTRFDAAYNNAKIYYNYLSQTSYNDAIQRQATFHRSNVYADPSKRRQGPDFMEMQVANPYHITQGIITPGLYGERTKSIDELAQANKVLLNPTTAGENLENAQWGESPNNNFIGYFDDVLVQAQYDTAGTHKDLVTGEIVSHQAGDLKLDDTGNFYYEKLDGRDVYNRRVLNKMNTLTVDGSWANQFDFFDSDDINQKSAIGSIMKNLALVGSMFLPYVGPWIAGISVATQMAGLLGTLGKMVTMDSNNSTFSAMEGWSKSVSRQTASTEYAQGHPWCLENMINLVGDVMGQLKEQRFIFEKAPFVLKGAPVINEANRSARYTEILERQKKLLTTELATLEKNGASNVDLLKFSSVLNQRAASAAQAEMDSFIRGYNKLGEIISRGYMTAITVGDTYGEAKAAGASDIDATLLTLGYAMGEYQLLKTGLGRWNIPETRLDTYRNQAIARALYTARQSIEQVAPTVTREGKKAYVQKLLNAGKNAFNDVWTASKANGSKTLSATLTSAAGEGVEEMSEELLADFSKGCYDVVKWLQGEDTRLNTFGYDFTKGQWEGSEIRDRYLLSLVGGAIGGGLTNVVTNYKMIDNYNSMSRQEAVEQLVYMARNGGLDQFMRDVNKMILDDPNLSTDFEIIDNQVVFNPGTRESNRDVNLKRAIQNQVNILQGILAANGAVSDNQFLDAQTLGDLRFTILQKSTTAGAFIQEYNTLLTRLAQDTQTLKNLATRDLDTNNDGQVSDSEARHNEVSDTTKESIQKLQKSIKETKQKLDDLVSGKRSLEFIATSLWEVSTFLSGNFTRATLPLFAEQKYGKKFQDLTEEEKNQATEEYKNWKTTELRDQLHSMAMTFLEFEKQFSSVVKNHEQTYLQNTEQIRQVLQLVDKLNRNFLYMDNSTILPNMQSRLAGKENLMSDQMSIFASELISIFGTDEQKSKLEDIKTRRAEAAKNITEETTEEEVAAIHNPFNVEQTNLVYDALKNNVHSYIQEVINGGFATKEVKNQITSLLDQVRGKVIQPLEIEREQELQTSMDISEINEWQELNQILFNDMRAIEALNNTPLEQNLNEFAISIGRDPISITQLIDKLNATFNETSENISNFQVSGLEQELANAIQTLELYQAAIKAARTDNAGLNNLFGFNATLNEVSGRVEGTEKLELAEIDKNVADLFLEDINTNLNKLKLLGKIHALNKGQKLSKQDRVATRKDLLMYKRMKYIVQILDKMEGLDEDSVKQLMAVMETQPIHEELLNNNQAVVQDQEAFQKENLTIENAIYDFFQTNQSLLENPTKLAELINPTNLDLYTNAEELLNEDLEAIDDNSFVWWLASRAALKAGDFYYQYRQIINIDAEKPLAPIATQELAVYNNYASIINGNVFDTFHQAMRLTMVNHWQKADNETDEQVIARRKEILKKLGKSEKLADEKLAKYALNSLSAPRYSNIVLTEGIPGSGKSAGVFNLTVQLLNKFHPKVLVNVAIAHGANPDSAKGLQTDMSLENAQTFGRDGLMKYINPKWVDYNKDGKTNNYVVPATDYEITSENEIRSKLGINETMQNPPSLIIIDEISKFTSYDLDQIDKFARNYGITVLVAGDFDQSGVVGQHKIPQDHAFDGIEWHISLDRTNFIRSPKLGVSMRTDNTLKTNNLIKTQLFLNSPDGVLELEYAENEEGLFGDKVIPYGVEISNTAITSDKDLQLSNILAEVDKIAATLKEGEKIGYIFNDKNSKLYDALSKRNDIELFEGGSAQGLEGRYYIIDLNYSPDTKTFLRDLYTGISRAQQGSLIIAPSGNHESVVKINSTIKNEAPIKEPLPANVIRDFARRRKEVLDKIASEGKTSDIIPRNKVNVATPVASIEGLDEGVGQADQDAVLQAAINAEKQNLLQAISQAQSEDEINQLITNSKYAQLGTDVDIISAKDQKVRELSNAGTTENIVSDPVHVPQPDPYDNDIAPVTETDIIDPATYQADIDESNESRQLPEASVEEKENEPIHISMLLHSFNTFETGVEEGENGEIIQLGTPERIAKRIDSVNGLIKLDEYLGHGRQTLQEYVDILGDLRSIIFNTENKADIDKAIKDYFGLSNIYTTFALKSSFRMGDNFQTDEFGYPRTSPNSFEKSKRETTLFNGSKDANSQRIHSKSLVLIIGTKETGNILELPLLALSSPFTLLQVQNADGKLAFSEVYQTFISEALKQNPNWEADIMEGKDPGLNLITICDEIISKYGNVVKYKELIDLFKIFKVTDNFVKYIRDTEWTPMRDLHLTGAHVTNQKGYYQLEDGLRFNDQTNPQNEWISVTDFAGVSNYGNRVNPNHNTQTTTTQIFLVGQNDVEVNGKKMPIKKGHPFVLVSYDKSLQGDIAIIEQFFAQVENPEIPKKVVLMYITPPTATIGEYCDQIDDFINKRRDDISIGYFPTAFKLLKGLVQDQEVVDLINRKLGRIAPRLLSALESIPIDATAQELKALLNQTQNWSEDGLGKGPETLGYLFRGSLHKLSRITDLETAARSRDNSAIQILESAANRLGITLYHHFPIPRNDHNSNKYFILPNPHNDYTLAGKPCLIHGKVDSYTFEGNMGSFVSQLLNGLNLNAKNHWQHPDNPSYNAGNSNLQENPIRTREDEVNHKRQREISNTINQVRDKAGIQVDPNIFEGKSIQEARVDIANMINSTEGNTVAFVLNGNLHISNGNDSLQGQNKIIYSNGTPVTDISSIVQANGEAPIQLSIDGRVYEGTINKNTGSLEFWEPKTPTQPNIFPTISVTPDTFAQYIAESKSLLGQALKADKRLAAIFDSITYEEFMQSLQILPKLGPAPGNRDMTMREFMIQKIIEGKQLTPLQQQIINDMLAVEQYKKQEADNNLAACPIIIKVMF